MAERKTTVTGVADKGTAIIKRTFFEMNRPGGTDVITTITDDAYELSKPEDRKDLLARMVGDAYDASHYDSKVYDRIRTELEEVIADFRDNLPFE